MVYISPSCRSSAAKMGPGRVKSKFVCKSVPLGDRRQAVAVDSSSGAGPRSAQ